jgi:hypothetical protein
MVAAQGLHAQVRDLGEVTDAQARVHDSHGGPSPGRRVKSGCAALSAAPAGLDSPPAAA